MVLVPGCFPIGSYVELTDGQRGHVDKHCKKMVRIDLGGGAHTRRLPINLKLLRGAAAAPTDSGRSHAAPATSPPAPDLRTCRDETIAASVHTAPSRPTHRSPRTDASVVSSDSCRDETIAASMHTAPSRLTHQSPRTDASVVSSDSCRDDAITASMHTAPSHLTHHSRAMAGTFPVGSYVQLADGRKGRVTNHCTKMVKVRLANGTYTNRLPKNLTLVESGVPAVVGPDACSAGQEREGLFHGACISDDEHSHDGDSSVSMQTALSEVSSDESRRLRTRYRADPRKDDFPFALGAHRVGHITLLLPGEEDALVTRTLAGRIFGDRLRRVDFTRTAPSKLLGFKAPMRLRQCGFVFQLLAKNVKSERAKFGRLAKPELYYVLTEGPGLEAIDVEGELDRIADFASIGSPGKIASRLELLLSPARTDGILTLRTDDFEFLPAADADCSEGNCFAPPSFFDRLRRQKVVRKTQTTVQLRFILGGALGKGTCTLTRKEGVTRLQLPPSMVKIAASAASASSGINLVAITKAFPSRKSALMEKYLAGAPLPATALDELQHKLSPMFEWVLRDAGVPGDAIREYNRRKTAGKEDRRNRRQNLPRRSRRLQHVQSAPRPVPPQDEVYMADLFLVGAADPTPGSIIPHGHVAIPGLPPDVRSVLVSRAPAMDTRDVLRLPVFRSSLLADHAFGEIFFGQGSVPLPNLVADGDLDGDLYFVLWDQDMVQSVPSTNVTALEQCASSSKKRAQKCIKRVEGGKGWFSAAQKAVADVDLEVRLTKLISILYNESKAELEQGECVYEDYVAYGNAYKKSLDLKKHGNTIMLPEHLWDALTELNDRKPWKLGEFLTKCDEE